MMFSSMPSLRSLPRIILFGAVALLSCCNAVPLGIGRPYPGIGCSFCNINGADLSRYLMSSKHIKIPDDVGTDTLTKRRIPLRVDAEDNVSRHLMVSMNQIDQDPPTIRVTVTNNNTSPVTIYTPSSPLDQTGSILDLLYPVSIDGKLTKNDTDTLRRNSPPMTVDEGELNLFNQNLIELNSGESTYRDVNLDKFLSKDGEGIWQHKDGDATNLRLRGKWSGVWDMKREELIQELTDSIKSKATRERLPIVGGFSPGWRWRLRHEWEFESNDLPLEFD